MVLRIPTVNVKAVHRQWRTIRLTHQNHYSTGSKGNKNASSLDRSASIDIQSYLESWAGGSLSSPKKNQTSASSSSILYNRIGTFLNNQDGTPNSSLAVSGRSYLVPTIRLQGNSDTVEELLSRLDESRTGTTATDNRSSARENKTSNNNQENQWRFPVVLDLTAYLPYGSPHYVPPKSGFLIDIVRVLDAKGISVVGITGSTSLTKEIEEEAVIKLGLPTLLGSRGVSHPTGVNKEQFPFKYDLGEVIQLVKKKGADEEKSQSNDKTRTQLSDKEKNDVCVEDMPSSKSTSKGKMNKKSSSARTIVESDRLESCKPSQNQDGEVGIRQREGISTTTMYHGSIRSGQQVSSDKGQSLVIMGSINSGGEALSDGDIFVFGKLRGRALAGLSGDKNAKIVATGFDAELVAIGDAFTTIDEAESIGIVAGEPVMVCLNENEELEFARVTV